MHYTLYDLLATRIDRTEGNGGT